MKTSLQRAIAGDTDYAIEFRTTWPNGSTRWIYERAEASRDPDRRPMTLRGVSLDVTDRKLLEEQLRQSQKLEAIGHLAGGVAHDFNNVLTAIIGYSDVLLSEMDSGTESRAEIEEIRKAGDRAKAITQQLLAFSRRQILQPRVLNINELVEDMQKMLERLVPEHIRIARHLPPGVGSIKADATQIEQVLLNLVVNAKDAMPHGGILTIETANATLDASYQLEHAPVVPGDYVMLAVTDTGIGMNAETQRRIFEPFFTTKAVGKGTGLGLATVYGIVKQSGGYIWVYSEPGHGTTFKVYLPRVYEAVEPAVTRAEAPATRRDERETILVVEDDAGVRSLTCRILDHRGYRVLEASDPAEALEVARSYEHHINLLLSDVIMPGSGSVSLFEELLRQRRSLRVLYMSGYADETIVRHGLLVEGAPFLQKPFTAKGLVEKVREVLDSPAA